jgi:hypothetical protein
VDSADLFLQRSRIRNIKLTVDLQLVPMLRFLSLCCDVVPNKTQGLTVFYFTKMQPALKMMTDINSME